MPNFILGKNAKAYASATTVTASTNSAYATAAAAATEVTNAKDVKLDFSVSTADVATRASGGWGAQVATIKSGSVSFTAIWKPSDPVFAILLQAWLDSEEIFFTALDGAHDVAGSQGPAGNFSVSDLSRSEGLNEAITAEIKLVPSSYNGWYTAT